MMNQPTIINPKRPPVPPDDPMRTIGGEPFFRPLWEALTAMKEEPDVMTDAQIKQLNVTPEIAAQALEHTRARAEYALEMRHRLETRAAALLRTFLTLALAIVGYGVTLEQIGSGVDAVDIGWFVASAAPLFLAAGCMLVAIWDRDYGTLGAGGDLWLAKGALDGAPKQTAYFDAMLAASYERRNRISLRSNYVAVVAIRCGLVLSLLTPFSLWICF